MLKVIFASSTLDLSFKKSLLEAEKSIKFSDFDVLEELGCYACLPTTEDKKQVWKRYVETDNLNVKQIEASAKHFYNTENIE